MDKLRTVYLKELRFFTVSILKTYCKPSCFGRSDNLCHLYFVIKQVTLVHQPVQFFLMEVLCQDSENQLLEKQ